MSTRSQYHIKSSRKRSFFFLQAVRMQAKTFHDVGRMSHPGTQQAKENGDLDVEIGNIKKFTIPSKTAIAFQRAFCALTGELPFQPTWAKILMFSNHLLTSPGAERDGYYFQMTEASGNLETIQQGGSRQSTGNRN